MTPLQSGSKQYLELVMQSGSSIKFSSLVALMQWLQTEPAVQYLRYRMTYYVSILTIGGK